MARIKIVKRCGSILQIARYFVFQIATDLETEALNANLHLDAWGKKCKSKSVHDQSTMVQHYAGGREWIFLFIRRGRKSSVENSRGRKIFRHPFGFNYTRGAFISKTDRRNFYYAKQNRGFKSFISNRFKRYIRHCYTKNFLLAV